MTTSIHRLSGYCSLFALTWALSGCSGHEETAASSAALARPLVGTVAGRTIDYRQRRLLSEIGTTPVTLGNGRRVRIDQAANAALSRHRQMVGELSGASAALLAPAVSTEELIELEHTALLVATTALTVKDPALLRGRAPLVGQFRFKGPGALSFEGMTPQQREVFEKFKLETLTKSKTHPLAAAARQGSQALLDAVLSGKGDMVITTEVEVPLDRLTAPGGTYRQPTLVGGSFNYTTTQRQQILGFGSNLPTFGDEVNDGFESEDGEAHNATQFVNGFTEADAFEWRETWDIGIGHVKAVVGASYGLGLRIPIRVTSSMTPTEIYRYGGDQDDASNFDTELTVEVLDADEEFYEKAGLPNDEVQDGQELVLNADAHVQLEVDVLGLAEVNIGDGVEVDFGRDFQPPFGDCGTSCGLDFWLPAELTHTEVDAGIAGVDAQIGFNLAGDGEVVLGYRSLYDDQTVSSSLGGGTDWATHDVSFTHERTRRFHTELPALSQPGSKTFGYELSDVEYDWHVSITPGIKGSVWIDASFVDWNVPIAPIWLNFAEVELGTVPFGPHAGSRESRKIVRGEKSWSELQQADVESGVRATTTPGSAYQLP